jgi:hypothetical protein
MSFLVECGASTASKLQADVVAISSFQLPQTHIA